MLEWVLRLRATVTTPRGVKYGPPLAKESDALVFMRGQLGALIDAKHHDHEVSRGGGHTGFAVETIGRRLETGLWPAPLSLRDDSKLTSQIWRNGVVPFRQCVAVFEAEGGGQ